MAVLLSASATRPPLCATPGSVTCKGRRNVGRVADDMCVAFFETESTSWIEAGVLYRKMGASHHRQVLLRSMSAMKANLRGWLGEIAPS